MLNQVIADDGRERAQQFMRDFANLNTQEREAPGGALPAGVVSLFAGASAPGGWLLCDGAAVSRATYAALFAVIGTAFGAGDGSTTFNLPDFGGAFPRGGTPGASGGASTVTLAENNLPAHTHQLMVTNLTATSQNPEGCVAAYEAAGATFIYRDIAPNAAARSDAIGDTGGDAAFSILPPYLSVSFIIKS